MTKFTKYFILFTVFHLKSISSDGPCGTGKWLQYNNEKCFLLIEKLVTQSEAKEMCRLEGLKKKRTELVSIDSTEEEDFVNQFLIRQHITDSIWTDLYRIGDSDNYFLNSDGEEPEYHNWATERPTSDPKKRCAQIRAPYEGMVSPIIGKGVLSGKWEDVVCFKKNIVLCQKFVEWDQTSAQRAVLKTQRQLKSIKKLFYDMSRKTEELSLNKLKALDNRLDVIIDQFHDLEGRINDVDNKSEAALSQTTRSQFSIKQNEQPIEQGVPLGFVYMQLPGQAEPGKLWPSTVWADITDHYAGLFFRVLGNGSAPFYQIQNENYPKLSAISSYVKQKVLNKESNDTFRPTDRWSKEVFTGYEPTGDSKDNFNQNFLSFKVSSGEVRPRNTAVLIWQRTN